MFFQMRCRSLNNKFINFKCKLFFEKHLQYFWKSMCFRNIPCNVWQCCFFNWSNFGMWIGPGLMCSLPMPFCPRHWKQLFSEKKNLNCLRNKEFLIFKEWNFMVLQFCPKSTKDKTSPSQKRSKSRPITSGHVVHTSWTTNQKKVLENKLRLMVSSDDISCILQKTRRRSVPTKEKPRERESGKTSNYSLSALQKVLKKIRYKFIYHAIPLQKQTNDFICSL